MANSKSFKLCLERLLTGLIFYGLYSYQESMAFVYMMLILIYKIEELIEQKRSKENECM